MQSSPFGQVLTWVRNQLNEAKENMETSNCIDPEQSIPNALHCVGELLENENPAVTKACNEAAKAKYSVLVTLLQQNPITRTPQSDEIARKMDEEIGGR